MAATLCALSATRIGKTKYSHIASATWYDGIVMVSPTFACIAVADKLSSGTLAMEHMKVSSAIPSKPLVLTCAC
eukprot:2375476-Karenia_brevis.AAC.1